MAVMSEALQITDLSLAYPGEKGMAVSEVTLSIESGEVLTLIGKSGSGKSTLLRLIAGLERPSGGAIHLGGECLADGRTFVRPERRNIGLVAQGTNLFPHLDVSKNIAYGLRKRPRREQKEIVARLLEQVGLTDLAKRYPAELSGGEAQRIALARALAPEPRLLLLDEPFSNLDAELRERLRDFTGELLRKLNTTAVFVTHHGDDALSVGDRIAVMEGGKLVQVGAPRDVWEEPATASVAALFGSVNDFHGSDHIEVESHRPRLARPEQLSLCPEATDCIAKGTVSRTEFLGSFQRVSVQVEDSDLVIRVRAPAGMPIAIGSRVGVRWVED